MLKPTCPGCYCSDCGARSCTAILSYPDLPRFIIETGRGETGENGRLTSCSVSCALRPGFSYEVGCTQCSEGHIPGHPQGDVSAIGLEVKELEEECDI